MNNAINAQERVTTLSEHSADAHAEKHVDPDSGRVEIKLEEHKQWQWSVAEELVPSAKAESAQQILNEVGRMEVWLDGVGDGVKKMKEHLDVIEENVLHVKDS